MKIEGGKVKILITSVRDNKTQLGMTFNSDIIQIPELIFHKFGDLNLTFFDVRDFSIGPNKKDD